MNHFRYYIYGRKFNLITDHRPLVWVHSVKDPTSRLLRWRLKLAEYDYKISYKSGKTNLNADALFRNPVPVLPLSSDASSEMALFDPPTTSRPSTTTQEHVDLTSEARQMQDYPLLVTEENQVTQEIGARHEEAPQRIRRTITTIRDRLVMRNDHIACLVSCDGQPADQRATDLFLQNKLPTSQELEIGRVKVHTSSGKNLILVPVKQSALHSTSEQDLLEAFRALYDAATELGLSSFSISQGCVGNISWRAVRNVLRELFMDTDIQIYICTHEVRITPESERREILRENHISAYAGHKGITKTYRRIRERYFWPTLKADVTNYVTSCTACQRMKLTRVKTRQGNL